MYIPSRVGRCSALALNQLKKNTGKQPGPDPEWPEPFSDFIISGEWGPGFNAQNEMLDEFRDENGLADVDWRPSKPWYVPNE